MSEAAFKITELFDRAIQSENLAQLQQWGLEARAIARGSADKTKVGCIILDQQFNPLAVGCNNFAPHIQYSEAQLNNRAWKLDNITHAEEGAIHAMMRAGIPLTGKHMITTVFPSLREAILAAGSGMKEIYVDHAGFNKRVIENWGASMKEAKQILSAANIKVTGLAIPLSDNTACRLPIPSGAYRTGYAISEIPTLIRQP